MIAKRMNHGGAGNGETPSQTILVVRGRRHVRGVVESWLSGLVVVESGEGLDDGSKTTLGFIA